MNGSVCPPVCLSLSPSVPIIVLSRVITIDISDVYAAKGQGQRSKFKVTEVKPNFAQFRCFRTATPD